MFILITKHHSRGKWKISKKPSSHIHFKSFIKNFLKAYSAFSENLPIFSPHPTYHFSLPISCILWCLISLSYMCAWVQRTIYWNMHNLSGLLKITYSPCLAMFQLVAELDEFLPHPCWDWDGKPSFCRLHKIKIGLTKNIYHLILSECLYCPTFQYICSKEIALILGIKKINC